MDDVWTRLSALEPSVPVTSWGAAIDTAIAEDTLEESSSLYHDKPRELTQFEQNIKAPSQKWIKQGISEDIELALFERVASILETAASNHVILSAPKVIALLRA
jgi:hypothetical protein